ncbi:phage replisome organizer N-terminal domain-containing protein [Clostridium beijerinckii]|uniref:phage replisome organizer N-terminal domain-containing protein n=1 Tax=Clostridium beijerinckii TaxID=1520 RepID=UPI00080A69D4|nr:phage replisome organizer N-terminal domain-containing protein [Clostridium beijerinckii]OCA98707.1 replication protein [Clostridium beijerinckii]
MRERKCVKFNVNMYEDTKFKIIDRMEKRDLINYVWTRLVVLAGKVNLEGELFLSRNIPYTLETLAIEFNREVSEIELAIKTFVDLEMVELTQDKIYKVKNFVKHQNIKTKEKVQNKHNTEEVEINDKKQLSSSIENINVESESKHKDNKVIDIKDNIANKNVTNADNKSCMETSTSVPLNSCNKNVTEVDNEATQKLNMEKYKSKEHLPNEIVTTLEKKKVKNGRKPKKKEKINEISVVDEVENDDLMKITEGEPVIGKDEEIVLAFSF